ncbi:uncharacterized protein LOC120343427 [Styela clava]
MKMFRREVLVSFLLYFCLQTVQADDWSYAGEHGPSSWSEEAPACGDDAQSPVDIQTNEVLIDPNLRMLKLQGYGQHLDGGEVLNNGHTVKLNFPANKTFILSGGGMGENKYRALQLHIHWATPGSTDGSEHTVNGGHYPAEMHIVHIKEPYTSVGQVKDMSDGLAVLGVFLKVGNSKNVHFEKLLQAAQRCRYKDSTSTLESGPRLISLLPDSASYYRYSGSLTTPPCYETVTWTVFQEPVEISQSQMEMLQSLKSVSAPDAIKDRVTASDDTDLSTIDNLGGNYRPVQSLNGRIVTSYLDIKFFLKEDDETHGWTYYGSNTGTDDWSHSYPVCGQQSQSPINVVESKVVKLQDAPGSNSPVKPIIFDGYNQALKGSFVNDGHSAKLNIDKDRTYTISGGGLSDSYTALQLHFHWGDLAVDGNIHGGSEHTVNGRRYPAEMHIVHGKNSYLSSLADFQKNSSDAYVVIGVLLDVAHSGSSETKQNNDYGKNSNMQKLLQAFEEIIYKDDSVSFPSGPSLISLLPSDYSFYRYNGSLTTPPCSETVIWTLLSHPIEISVNQFIAFERLFSNSGADVTSRETIKHESTAMLIVPGAGKTEEISEDTPLANLSKGILDTITATLNKANVPSQLLPGNETKDHLLRNNYRPIQPLNGRTVYVYEDVDNPSTVSTPTGEPVGNTGPPVLEIVLCTLAGIIVFIVMIVLVMKCCCKKKQKKSKYTGARQTTGNEEGLTL